MYPTQPYMINPIKSPNTYLKYIAVYSSEQLQHKLDVTEFRATNNVTLIQTKTMDAA